MTGARRRFAGLLAIAAAITVAGCSEPNVKPPFCGSVADAHAELRMLRQAVAYTSATDLSYEIAYRNVAGHFRYVESAAPAVEKRAAFEGYRAATRASIYAASDRPVFLRASERVNAVLAHFDALC